MYADTSVSGQVTIRWAAVVAGSSGTTQPVNFSVTLFQNGSFRFDYGNIVANNTLTPTIGVSAGNGQQVYVLSPDNGLGNLSNGASVSWTSTGVLTTDIGAYEFQGNSNDHTPPQVTSITNLPTNGGTTDQAFTSVTLNFNEPLDQISASSPANFTLVYSPSGVLGAPDNTRIQLTPEYSGNSVTLQLPNGVLASGLYQLTIQGIYDISGNLMQGNGGGALADQYVTTFTIDRSHDTPPVAANGTATTAENQPITISLSSTDPNGEPLTYSIVGQPQHGTLSAINPANDTVVYTPNQYFNGTDTFQFQVDDGKLGISTATVSLTVTPVNQTPVAKNASATTNENMPVAILLPASDVETPQPDLTYNLVNAPQHGTLTQVAPGVWTYTPNQYFSGTDTFTYTVTDRGNPDGSNNGAATSAPATVTITVNHVNQPPSIAPIGTLQVNEGSTLTYTIPATDPDAGAVLHYSLINNTVTGATVDPNTGVFSWTPAAGPVTQAFTVQVTYGTLTAQETFNVAVAHVAPVISLTGAASATAGQSYSVNFSATEVGAHTVSGWTINWGDGSSTSLAGTATSTSHVYAQVGSYSVIATATDDVASYASQPVAVQVSASGSASVTATAQPLAVNSAVAQTPRTATDIAAAAPASDTSATGSKAAGIVVKSKPSIALDESASSFSLVDSQIHAWLDDLVKQREARARDANAWSIVVKQRTLH